MMTVKEVSILTGISVRTLHYYDEIGLFSPTDKSEAGYRLYDDKAVETLQQILFFREFQIPLSEIKSIMENPALDRSDILKTQRKMLVAKRERIDRLITGIDDILKGANNMDFEIFNKTELEEMFRCMYDHMPENFKEIAVKEFGSVDNWKKHYIERLSSEDMQKSYSKVVEWYGGKDEYLSAVQAPVTKEAAEIYSRRIEAVLEKLYKKCGAPVDSLEVREIIGEYGFVMKQFCQVRDEKELMLAQARAYRSDPSKTAIDERYGSGAAEFFAEAIEGFYNR